MKGQLALILIFTTLTSISFAQKRSIDVSDFSKFSLGVSADTYLMQGSKNEVVIDCDDDDFEKLDIKVSGDKLIIRQKNKNGWGSWSWGNSDIEIYITMKEIEGLYVSGSGNIESKGSLTTEDLDLGVSGSGDIELDVDANDVSFRISGSGSISLDGSGDEAKARISGSGKIKAEGFEVNSFDASISGSGSCYITAKEEVIANISGSGNVFYKGDPDSVQSNSSGSGKIRKL